MYLLMTYGLNNDSVSTDSSGIYKLILGTVILTLAPCCPSTQWAPRNAHTFRSK